MQHLCWHHALRVYSLGIVACFADCAVCAVVCLPVCSAKSPAASRKKASVKTEEGADDGEAKAATGKRDASWKTGQKVATPPEVSDSHARGKGKKYLRAQQAARASLSLIRTFVGLYGAASLCLRASA